MKILRKRVGSIEIEEINKVSIINDSIFMDNKIIFNFLPIKNLPFFSMNLSKSNTDSKKKYWIFLDLNLKILFDKILEGKIITNRELIFEMIISSMNRLKISNQSSNIVNVNKILLTKIFENDNFKIDNIFCFEKEFVKYGKIFFDINRRLITIEKCKKKRIKLPIFIVLNRLLSLKKIVISFNEKSKIENKESMFIISKNDEGLLESLLINPYFNDNIRTIIFSEDLNFQMENYLIEIGHKDMFNQLEFESNNFYLNKKNIFILTNNLTETSINYLSYCNYEKIFCYNFKSIDNLILNLTKNFNKYRIIKNDDYNNYLVSNYILEKRVFFIEDEDNNLVYSKLECKNFPYLKWKKLSDIHFLKLDKSNKNISNFIKIGKEDDWSDTYLHKLINEKNEKCSISLSDLEDYSIETNCGHKFNLEPILDWVKDNNDCPICRNKLNLDKIKFIESPDITDFIKFLHKFEKKITIISDKLWYHKFSENKLFNKKKGNLKLVNQIDYIDGKFRKDKANLLNLVLNLSSLSDNDIIHINKHYKYINEVQLIELV